MWGFAFAFGVELVPAWGAFWAGCKAGDFEFPLLAGPDALAGLKAEGSKDDQLGHFPCYQTAGSCWTRRYTHDAGAILTNSWAYRPQYAPGTGSARQNRIRYGSSSQQGRQRGRRRRRQRRRSRCIPICLLAAWAAPDSYDDSSPETTKDKVFGRVKEDPELAAGESRRTSNGWAGHASGLPESS